MGKVDVFEIPRRRAANLWRCLAGIAVISYAATQLAAPHTGWVQRLVLGALVGVLGAILAWGGFWGFLSRPLALQATADGVWFGAGAIVPWHEIVAICTGVPFQSSTTYAGQRAAPAREIFIAFRHWRTMLRVPCWLWFSSLVPATVAISLRATAWSPAAVIAQLEALRLAVCDDKNGVLPGASELPAARIVARS